MLPGLLILLSSFLIFSVSNVEIPPLLNIEYDVPHKNFVYILDEKNLDEIITSQPLMLIQFYIDRNIMHRYMELDFEKAAKLAAETLQVPFGFIDIDNSPTLKNRFMFSDGFQLVVFKKKVSFSYVGPEDTEGLVEQLKKYKDPNWKPVFDSILKLTPETVESVKKEKLSFIYLYSKDTYSRKMLPIFVNASVQLEHFYNIKLGIGSVETHPELQHKLSATSIPQAFICIHGKCYPNMERVMYKQDLIGTVMATYHGERKIKSLESFHARCKQHWMRHEQVYLAFVSDDDITAMEALEHAIYALHNTYTIYYTTDQKLKAHYNCTAKECFRVCYPPFIMLPGDAEEIEKNMLKDDDLKDYDKIHDYIFKNTHHLVGYKYAFNSKLRYYYQLYLPYLIVYGPYSYNDTKYQHSYKSNLAADLKRLELIPVAKKFKNINFAIANSEILSKTQLTRSDAENPVVIIYDENDYMYVMDSTLEATKENIEAFVTDFIEENLDPSDNSAEIPEYPYDEDVLVLTTKNFMRELKQQGRDVFLILYHQGSHHLLYDKTEIHKLIEMTHQNKEIEIAKFEIDNNKLPKKYQANPQIGYYLIKDGDWLNGIPYEEDFKAIKIIKFIEKNSELFTRRETSFNAEL